MTSSRSNVTSTPNKSSLPSKTSPVSSNNSGSVLTPSVALNRIQPSATSRPSSSQSNSSSTVTSITSKVKSPTTSKTPLNNTGSTNSNASNISTNVGQGSLKRTPSKQENSKISASSSSINATPITSPPPLVRSDSNSSLKSSTSTTSNTSLNTMPSNRNDEKEATILVKQMEGLKSRLEREKQELDRLVAEKELEIRSHISAHQDKADDIKAELFKLERTKEVHEKTVEMLTKEKMELEHNMDSLKSELKRTLASLHSAQIENSTLKNELDAVEERCTSQVEILNNDLKRKQQQVGQLQAEKEQLEYRVQALQSELLHQLSSETDQEKMAILENTISLLENEKKSLKSQFETLRNSYDADTRNLANERDSIMKELVFSNNQIALNIEEIEKAKHRYTLLEQELFNSKQESSSMIDLLKDEIRTKSEQIEELSNELSSLKNLSLEGEERSNEMSSLLSTISTLTIENNAIQQQLHELKERNMDMAKQLEFKEEIIEEEKTTVQRLTANIEELKTMLKELEGSLRIENNLKEQLAFTLATEQKSREITEASVRESAQYISDLEEKLSQEISSKQSLIEFYEVRIAQLQNDFDRLDTLKRESENQVAKTQSENNILQEQLLNEIEGSALLKINMEKSEERILLLEQTFKSQLEVISHNEKLLKQEVETLNETLRRERSTVESLRNSLVTEVSAQKVLSQKILDLESALSAEEKEKMNAIRRVDDMIIENESLINHISENKKKMKYLEELVNQEKSSISSKEAEIRIVLEKRIQELELHSLSLNNEITKLKEAAQSEKELRVQSEKTLKDDFQKQRKNLEGKINDLSSTKEHLEQLLSSEKEQLAALDQSSKREIKKLQASLLEEKDFIITLEKRLKEEQDNNVELSKRLDALQSSVISTTDISNFPEETSSAVSVEDEVAANPKESTAQQKDKSAVGGVSLIMGVFGLGVGVVLPALLRKYELLPSSFGL